MAEEDQPPLVVHLVHGTWPYGIRGKARWAKRHRKSPTDCPKPWFLPGSDFCDAVANHLGNPLEFRSFEWSGRNSFAERQKAADAFRDYLGQSLASSPEGSQHVVVAHSHGGTVAFKALTEGESLPRQPVKLITMGTPFAALRQSRLGRVEAVIRYTASHRWILFVVTCFLLAYAGATWLHEAPPSLWTWLPPVASIAGSVLGRLIRNNALVSLLLDLLPVFALVWILTATGIELNYAAWSSFFALSLAIVLVGVLGLFKVAPKWTLRRPNGLAQLIAPSKPLGCTLHVLRVAQDEASLSIALAQVVDWALARFYTDVLVGWPTRFLTMGEKRFGFLFTAMLWLVAGIGFASYDATLGEGLKPIWVYPIISVFGVGIAFFVFGVAVIGVLVPFFAYLGSLALGVATGPAVIRYSGLVCVEVEQVPPGVVAAAEVLTVEHDADEPVGLSHSLHGRPETRQRVAEILAQC